LLTACEAAELLEISKARLGQLEPPKMVLKSMLLEKNELESLRKKIQTV